MPVTTRAVLTAVVAALVAGAAYAGEVPLLAVAAVLVVVVAVGWPHLVVAPAPRGAGVVIGLAGLAGLLAVATTSGEPFLRRLPAVLALAVLAAFVHELVRRDGRERLVESVAGAVCGLLAAVATGGWIAAARTPEGVPVVVVGALALAVGSVVSAAPLAVPLGAAVAVAAAAAAGAGAGALLPAVEPASGALVGLGVGVVAAAVHRLLDRLPSLRGRRAAAAGAVLPVTASGVLVYVGARVLVG